MQILKIDFWSIVQHSPNEIFIYALCLFKRKHENQIERNPDVLENVKIAGYLKIIFILNSTCNESNMLNWLLI